MKNTVYLILLIFAFSYDLFGQDTTISKKNLIKIFTNFQNILFLIFVEKTSRTSKNFINKYEGIFTKGKEKLYYKIYISTSSNLL